MKNKVMFVVFGLSTLVNAQSAFDKIKKIEQNRQATADAVKSACESFTAQAKKLVEQRESHMGVTADNADDIKKISDALQDSKLIK